MKFRSVTMEDAELILQWRNDPQTRAASHNTEEIKVDEHLSWLTAALDAPNRTLLIAEENGIPIGMVRIDDAGDVCELSWTVAPDARGRGLGKRMVALLAKRIKKPIRAEVKAGNGASARIAEYVGMRYVREEKGILHYQRAALK